MSEFEKLNEDQKIGETTLDEANNDVVNETTIDEANNDVVKEVNEEDEADSTKEANEFDKAPSGSDKKTNDAGDSTLVKTSQRKIRLNRRGFHLANSLTDDLETKDTAKKPSDINGNNDSLTKTKTEVPKKVISLRSVKRNLPEQTLAPVKRKFEKITFGSGVKKVESASVKKESIVTSENSSTKDLPAKKHKPITWP